MEQSDKEEIWRPVVGFEDFYQVSNFGRVKRVAAGVGAQAGKILKPNIERTGYASVELCTVSKSKRCKVHRLVLAAFLKPSDLQANHINGNKLDNRVENLEYVTGPENIKHAIEVLGLNNHGQGKKLNEEKVRAIKRLARRGYGAREIAERFGVSRWTVYEILSGRTWSYIDID